VNATHRGVSGIRTDVLFGTLDQGAAAVLAFLFHAVAAAVYPVAVYGWLVLVWGAIGFGVLSWRALIGVPFVVQYNEVADRDRPGLFSTVTIVTGRLQVALFVFATALVTWRFPAHGASEAAVLFGGGAFTLGFALSRELWRHKFIADLETRRLGGLGLASNLGGVAFFIIATFGLGQPPLTALVLLGVGIGLGAGVARDRGRKDTDPLRKAPPFFETAWAFGRHIMLGVVSTSGATQLVFWSLLMLAGEDEVAVFGAVVALAGLPRPALNAVTAVLTPRVARGLRDASAAPARWRILGAVTMAALASAVFAALVGPPTMRLLFPSVPTAKVVVMVVLAVGIAIEGGNAVLRGIFRGVGAPDLEARGAVAGAVVGLIAAAAALPAWGVTGAAIAVSAMQLAFFAVAMTAQLRPASVTS